MDEITLPAVDADRLHALLRAAGLHIAVDAHGTAFVDFVAEGLHVPDFLFTASVVDGILGMGGQRRTAYPADGAPKALATINELHGRWRWPTGRIDWAEDGTPRFRVEGGAHMPLVLGATDEQLLQLLRFGVSTIRDFTLAVHEALIPSPAPRVPEDGIDLESWLED